MIGAICYAELATTYPEQGGDFRYLSRAYGKSTGLMFAWLDFWIVRPCNIGAMAFVFAKYFAEMEVPLLSDMSTLALALSAVGESPT